VCGLHATAFTGGTTVSAEAPRWIDLMSAAAPLAIHGKWVSLDRKLVRDGEGVEYELV
jgi:hypothetical protein